MAWLLDHVSLCAVLLGWFVAVVATHATKVLQTQANVAQQVSVCDPHVGRPKWSGAHTCCSLGNLVSEQDMLGPRRLARVTQLGHE